MSLVLIRKVTDNCASQPTAALATAAEQYADPSRRIETEDTGILPAVTKATETSFGTPRQVLGSFPQPLIHHQRDASKVGPWPAVGGVHSHP